ncbi:ATPase with role in protein import into the ER [Pleurotus ostreatus]|nr:ATPase with role in protein import into the ER [Pleurotus ostreatus]
MRTIPSWVYFGKNEIIAGDKAKQAYLVDPKNAVWNINRLLGRKTEELSHEDIERWHFQIQDRGGYPVIKVQHGDNTRFITPQDVIAAIIKNLKQSAEDSLGHPVTHAVVAVPPLYLETQREAVKDAARLAGLAALRVTADSVCIGLDHGFSKTSAEYYTLVYDHGGESLDVSVLFIEDGIFEHLANVSNPHIGGRQFSDGIKAYLLEQHAWKSAMSKDVHLNPWVSARFDEEVERAKRLLSTGDEVYIQIDDFYNGKALRERLTRSKFEEISRPLLEKSLAVVKQALREARIPEGETLHQILLAGGSSNIPAVKQMLSDFLGKPVSQTALPEESSIRGTALQAAIFNSPVDDILGNFEVTPWGVSVLTHGGNMTRMILPWSITPVARNISFTTTVDNQENITIELYKGYDSVARGNKQLGQFEIHGLTPAPAGVPEIVIGVEVDAGVDQLKIGVLEQSSNRTWSTVLLPERSGQWEDALERQAVEAQSDLDHGVARRRLVVFGFLSDLVEELAEQLGSQPMKDDNVARLAEIYLDGKLWIETNKVDATTEGIVAQLIVLQKRIDPVGIVEFSKPTNDKRNDIWDREYTEL